MIVYFHIVLLSTGMVYVTNSYLFQGLTYVSWYKMLNAKQHHIKHNVFVFYELVTHSL